MRRRSRGEADVEPLFESILAMAVRVVGIQSCPETGFREVGAERPAKDAMQYDADMQLANISDKQRGQVTSGNSVRAGDTHWQP